MQLKWNLLPKGDAFMGYETKVILKTLFKAAKKAESKEEIVEMIRDVANAEGVVIEEDVGK